MSDTVTSALLEKIRKLLAKASDPSVTEAEATSYAAKAAAMLQERGLSMADVPEADRDEAMVRDSLTVRWGTTPWRRKVASAAARLYLCELTWYTSPGRGDTYSIVGRPGNVAVAREMVTYLVDTVLRLSAQYQREVGGSVRVQFERGCGMRLYNRLLEMRPSKTSASDASGLPALYENEDLLIKAWLAEQGRTPKISDHEIRASGEHAAAGYAAGSKIGLSPQVTGRASAARLLS